MTGSTGVSQLLLILFLAAPIGVAVYMSWLAWTRGGDPQQNAVTVEYEPPNRLTPAECVTLVDNAVSTCAITATIADLSVKGYLTIEQKEMSDSPASDHTDYVFRLAKPLTELGLLKPHERQVMTSIFVPTNPLALLSESLAQLEKAHEALGHERLVSKISRVETMAQEASDRYRAMSGVGDTRETVALSDLRDQFPLHLARIRDAIFDRLVSDGYYAHRPDRTRIIYGIWGVFVALVLAATGGGLAWMNRMAPAPLIGIGIFSGAIVLGFGWLFMPARTRVGAQTLGRVLGFREFLSRVEKDHIQRFEKTPELFEKNLPYAMALGVESRWAESFANIAVPPPQWYRGKQRDGFLPMHLTNDLNQMSNQAESGLVGDRLPGRYPKPAVPQITLERKS